jgi:TolB-like protein/class 3 adenylate cyclase
LTSHFQWSLGDGRESQRRPRWDAGHTERPRVKRKLVAIVAADVAGYSRLMGIDEEGTARRLREHQAAMRRVAEPYGGRVVKITGDAMLFDFSSIVAAVEYAMAIQRLMAHSNSTVVSDRKMLLRIGINAGEVIVEADDILGQVVNIATRLEENAEPGGICLSGAVYAQSEGKVAAEFVDLGEPKLKNIAEVIRVYGIRKQSVLELPEVTPVVSPIAVTSAPSVVVLPFRNLGGDGEQDDFVETVTEGLITDLSRISGIYVVAGDPTFSNENKLFDVRQIGKELGVRYVIQGSVQVGPNNLRVNAKLVDACTGVHLWAERFDRARKNPFTMQDEIINYLTQEIDRELLIAGAWCADRFGSYGPHNFFSPKQDGVNQMARSSARLCERLTPLSRADASAPTNRAVVEYRQSPTDVGIKRLFRRSRMAESEGDPFAPKREGSGCRRLPQNSPSIACDLDAGQRMLGFCRSGN